MHHTLYTYLVSGFFFSELNRSSQFRVANTYFPDSPELGKILPLTKLRLITL